MATKKRYIDADDLIAELYCSDKELGSNVWETSEIVDQIERMPTTDAVEVVRCKDCRYRIFDKVTEEWFCNSKHSGFVHAKPNDFCSYGERRTDD